MPASQRSTRRSLLYGGAAAGLALAGRSSALGEAEKQEISVAPAEDLMREHGVLGRRLLIHEESIRRLRDGGKDLPADALKNAASLVRSFIQDYHEKLEEEHVFPRFERAGKLVEVIKVLRVQHDAGRKRIETVLQLASQPGWDADEKKKLTDLLRSFIRMYRPHASREDTVVFPAMHEIFTPNEYADLGEDFERKEHRLFGKEGFHGIVEQVAAIEKQLGIYELDQFTPRA